MAKLNEDAIQDLAKSITGMFNVFKSSSERTYDLLIKRRDQNNKKIEDLQRQITQETRSGPPTADSARIVREAQNKIADLEQQTYDRIERYKGRFGERQLKNQQRKETDPAYKKFTRGKTKGDESRMDKVKFGLQKEGIGLLKNIGKKIGDFIKAPFKAINTVVDAGIKGILLALGFASFIKFLEGLEKASEWFGENPSFGEIISSGLANLIGFFTGMNEEERKKLAKDIKEGFQTIKDGFFYIIDSFKTFTNIVTKLIEGDFKGAWKEFQKDGAVWKFVTAMSLLALAILPFIGILTPLIALFGFLLSPFKKLLSKLKTTKAEIKKLDKQDKPKNNKTYNRNSKGQFAKKPQSNVSRIAKNLLEGLKKGGKYAVNILRNGTPLIVPFTLGSILANDDGKSTEIANQKNNLLKQGLTKNVDAKAEDVFVEDLNSTAGTDKYNFADRVNNIKDKNLTNALENYFTKNLKTELELKIQKMQLIPDESTALSETNTQLQGSIESVNKLTETLQNHFKKLMPNDVKVNNTSINNTQVTPKMEMKYFTPSKGKGPYSNVLT